MSGMFVNTLLANVGDNFNDPPTRSAPSTSIAFILQILPVLH